MTETKLPRDYLDAREISARLPGWLKPEPFGDDGWSFEGPAGQQKRIFVTLDQESDPDNWWIHASISYSRNWRIPSYSDLKQMHAAVFGDGFAYQCFVPPSKHISITNNVLHLWGRYDGTNVLPDFGRMGTI